MSRDPILKGLVLLLAGFSLGAAAGGTFTGNAVLAYTDREAEDRARCARALFNAFEKAVGHDEAIHFWRAELRRPTREPEAVEVRHDD